MHYYYTTLTAGPDTYFLPDGGIEHPKLISNEEAQSLRADADGLTIRVVLVTKEEYLKIAQLAKAGVILIPYGAIRQLDIEPKAIAEGDLVW